MEPETNIHLNPKVLALGTPLPFHPPSISVQLPTWADNEGWSSRDPRVLAVLVTAYPRFRIPSLVNDLAELLLARVNRSYPPNALARALLLPHLRYGLLCHEFLQRDGPPGKVDVFEINLDGHPTRVDPAVTTSCAPEGSFDPKDSLPIEQQQTSLRNGDLISGKDLETVFLVRFPDDLFPSAKAFWMHTGFGISSRRAEEWRNHLLSLQSVPSSSNEPLSNDFSGGPSPFYTIRERISALYSVTPDDVFLYPTGMSAITELALALFPTLSPFQLPLPGRAVAVFGFLYVDTVKVLSKLCRCDCRIYKFSEGEVDRLQADLEDGLRIDALFTEFPGNPLLQIPNLERLHMLSRRHQFTLVVDDTLATCVNINIIDSCDVICTSLSKMFSGAGNVMGGSIVLSPSSSSRRQLRERLRTAYDPRAWYSKDVETMELNSRQFSSRCKIACSNAQKVVQQLRDHQIVEEVYYPWGSPNQWLYDRYKISGGGYGYLLSIRFKSPAKARAFFDAIEICKGPSLGTNFTLSCAYTLLAHYNELAWAAEYGLVEDLVRISVGIEGEEWLVSRVTKALQAAADCPE